MRLKRRAFLKLAAGATGASLLPAASARATPRTDAFDDKASMLNDMTRCVGCQTCQSRCKSHHRLARTGDDPQRDLPLGLEAGNYTVIKRFYNGPASAFIKRQCMHCNHPSCETACPVGALAKQANGAVTYNAHKCIGCRYCMIACPFNVPRFEWQSPTPQIKKCTFCYERITHGEEPVCAEVCPTNAISYGPRRALIHQADERIAKNPKRYVHHLYGEHEVGGTSVMYLANVPFAKLGLREFDHEPLPALVKGVQQGMFQWFISPVALLGLLGLMRMANTKRLRDDAEGIEE